MLLFRLLLISFFALTKVQGLVYWLEDAYFQELSEEYVDVKASNTQVVWPGGDKSGLAVNLTLIKPLPKGIYGHFNLYLKSMGEYKTHSGITVALPWCKMIKDPVLMSSLIREIGMTVEDCPPPAGYYGTDFWAPSTELMPDYLPGVDYKVVFAVVHKKKVLMAIWVFVSIS